MKEYNYWEIKHGHNISRYGVKKIIMMSCSLGFNYTQSHEST